MPGKHRPVQAHPPISVPFDNARASPAWCVYSAVFPSDRVPSAGPVVLKLCSNMRLPSWSALKTSSAQPWMRRSSAGFYPLSLSGCSPFALHTAGLQEPADSHHFSATLTSCLICYSSPLPSLASRSLSQVFRLGGFSSPSPIAAVQGLLLCHLW